MTGGKKMFEKALNIIQEAISETISFIMAEGQEYKTVEQANENNSVFVENNLTIIGITGQIKGEIIFSFSDSIIKKVASKMIGMEVEEIDKLAFSAILEFANMLSGAATIKLVDYYESDKLNMSPPLVINGREFQISSEIGELKNYRMYLGEGEIIYIRVNLIHVYEG